PGHMGKEHWEEERDYSQWGSQTASGGEVKVSTADPPKDPGCLKEASFVATSEKQRRIAQHILTTYPIAKYGFLCSAAIRRWVENFTRGEGVNMINSVRIERLRDAITAPPRKRSWPHPSSKERAVARAAQSLNDVDLAFLKDPTRSRSFWEVAERAL